MRGEFRTVRLLQMLCSSSRMRCTSGSRYASVLPLPAGRKAICIPCSPSYTCPSGGLIRLIAFLCSSSKTLKPRGVFACRIGACLAHGHAAKQAKTPHQVTWHGIHLRGLPRLRSRCLLLALCMLLPECAKACRCPCPAAPAQSPRWRQCPGRSPAERHRIDRCLHQLLHPIMLATMVCHDMRAEGLRKTPSRLLDFAAPSLCQDSGG